MLTPTAHDPNRKAVLEEMKKNPSAFGTDVPAARPEPPRDLSTSGLVSARSTTPEVQPIRKGQK